MGGARATEQGFCGRFKKCLSCMVTLAIAGVVAILCWHFLGRPSVDDAKDFLGNIDFGDFSNVLENITDFDWRQAFEEDPFVGDNTTNAWKTRGEGLTLELQNALDENWQNEFETAVADWEESEVLTLTTTRVAVDHSCGRVDGVMLVCNGNFGETGWVGINEVEIEYASKNAPGFIVSSVAKMNEYYLNNADWAKRRYTMCHEIGHGFGLPHTDENPNNSDLGNCLDYTNTPENNQEPGEANFQRLRSIYIAGENGNDQSETGGENENGDAEGQDGSVSSSKATGNGRRLRADEQYPKRVVHRYYLPNQDVMDAIQALN